MLVLGAGAAEHRTEGMSAMNNAFFFLSPCRSDYMRDKTSFRGDRGSDQPQPDAMVSLEVFTAWRDSLVQIWYNRYLWYVRLAKSRSIAIELASHEGLMKDAYKQALPFAPMSQDLFIEWTSNTEESGYRFRDTDFYHKMKDKVDVWTGGLRWNAPEREALLEDLQESALSHGFRLPSGTILYRDEGSRYGVPLSRDRGRTEHAERKGIAFSLIKTCASDFQSEVHSYRLTCDFHFFPVLLFYPTRALSLECEVLLFTAVGVDDSMPVIDYRDGTDGDPHLVSGYNRNAQAGA